MLVEVIANDDFARLDEDQEVDIDVLSNDFGLFDGVKSLEVINYPTHGTVSVNSDNTIKYIPDLSYHGSDFFTYKVCNNDDSCDEAEVEILVDDINHFPIAVNDTVDYLHGTEVAVDVLKNDIVTGDFPISVSIEIDLKNGEAYFNDEHFLELSYERKFAGRDSLKYRLCDADNDCSSAWVMIHVKHDINTEFLIPEGFSPNGDGINDTFYVPDFSTYQNISLSVIDSWGNLAYQTNNYTNDWDGIANEGKYKGKLVPAGNYYYIIQIDGLKDRITGYVYITN